MKDAVNYSRIIAGTMTWGLWGKQLSREQMQRLIHHCLSLGIHTFDHADIYGDYTNEGQFGAAFANSGIKRETLRLISKCGIQLKGGSRGNEVAHYRYDREYIIWSVERSLQMLSTDYLDLLLLHRPSPMMHPQEIAEAVSLLKKDGKIRQFGVSNFTPSHIKLIEALVPVDGNQIEFSLTANTALDDGSLDDCMVNDRLAMSWSPLGTFFKEDNQQSKRIKKILKGLCEKYNATADQLLLAWVLKHPAKVYPVVGTATPERLALAMKARDIEMALEDWFILLEAAKGHQVA